MGKKSSNLKQKSFVEDWCFVCKDGGSLIICDYRDCPKAYHPECVDKDDSVLESDVRWTCNWHSCGVCNKPPKFYCFCCPFAVCKCCLNDAGFAVIRNNKGLCDSCLELAWLIEEKADVDSNGCKVDFHDRDTVEFLFYDYWEIIKKEEGLTSEQVISAYNKLMKSSDSLEHDEVKEGTSESDYESQLDIFDDDIDGCKQIGRRKRMTGQLSAMKRKAISKKKEFIGWGSEPLLEFLASIGKDTSTEMSQYAVVDIITEYCRKNKLFDPEKSKKINFDARLNAVLRRKSANRNNLYNLLTPHLAENLELSEDELKCGPENIDEDDLVPRKRQQRLDSTEKSNTKAEVVNVRKSCFASIVPENIKLLYLRKSLVEELSKQLETFEAKVVGTFVRVKSDPNDFLQKNSHMLSQVTGVQKTSTMNSEIMLLVCNTVKEVPIRRLSDDNFSEEECEDLCQRVKTGMHKRPTVVEIKQKARSLHEEITKHWISRELVLLQKRIDRANEKGWRRELYEYLDSLQLLRKPEEQSRLLREVPEVIVDDVDPEPILEEVTAKDEQEQYDLVLRDATIKDEQEQNDPVFGDATIKDEQAQNDPVFGDAKIKDEQEQNDSVLGDATIKDEQDRNDVLSESALGRTTETPCCDLKCNGTSCCQNGATNAAGIQTKDECNSSSSDSNKLVHVVEAKELVSVVKDPRDCKTIMQYLQKEKKELQSVVKDLNKYNYTVKDVRKDVKQLREQVESTMSP
ncbi:hypothetical protein LWI28_020464 [Acer negundo]|uniref:Uncharacterized protein n=1 Tax=Acer negundo TaxID=4023 RepID=A0AAD5IWS7_ACENE|nr:hypothetical protein LWI28_020464 [Acer negundo]